MCLGRFRWRYCLLTVLRLVDLFTNEGSHICRTRNASESRIEDRLRHARCGLNLRFEDVRLQRIKKSFVQQLGWHLIGYATSGFDEHLICHAGRLCCENRHPNRRENVEVVCLAGQKCLPVEMNRWKLDTGGVNRFTLRPGIGLFCRAFGMLRWI